MNILAKACAVALVLLPIIAGGLIVTGAAMLHPAAGFIVAGALIILDLNRKARP